MRSLNSTALNFNSTGPWANRRWRVWPNSPHYLLKHQFCRLIKSRSESRFEAQNPKQIPTTKIRTAINCLNHSDLEFVSDSDFQISDFWFYPQSSILDPGFLLLLSHRLLELLFHLGFKLL